MNLFDGVPVPPQRPLLITVRCIYCGHVEEGTTPTEAHDRMEEHYRERHRTEIARAVGTLRGPW